MNHVVVENTLTPLYISVKHEIFLTDVNNCFTVLRKAVQEIHALGALSEAQLQMGQPTARY